MARKASVEMKSESVRKESEGGNPAAKIEPRTITVEDVMQAIGAGAHSPTAIAKSLGYKSGSSSVIRRLKAVVPDLEGILAMCHEAPEVGKAKGKSDGKSSGKSSGKAKGKTSGKSDGKSGMTQAAGKWPRHADNPFRLGSYGTCFDILAAHPEGLTREKLIELLAKATSKDLTHAAYDAQVVLSARGAAGKGLTPFEGPRNRSCRFGFWVEHHGDLLKLHLDGKGH